MSNRSRRFLAALTAFVIASAFSRAQVVLNFDPAVKKMWFTGSDTVSIQALGSPPGWIVWGSGGTTISVGQPNFDPSALSSTVSPTSVTLAPSGSGGNRVAVIVSFSVSSGTTTFTGGGPSFALDYGTFPSFTQALIEAKTSLALEYGTGGSAMAVVQSAIPEPSTYAALTGLGALGLAVWRRRHRRVAA